ncbi:outer membrane-stress sensor serine endopeptidase DegS, partial [Klebsiella pneumoniae]
MPGKLLRSVLIGLLVGGLLLALMPSLRQWQLAPTTQNDTADDSPASYNAAVGGGGGGGGGGVGRGGGGG